MTELRKKVPYYDETISLKSVRLEPEGQSYEVHEGLEGLYVIENDGERTYLLWG